VILATPETSLEKDYSCHVYQPFGFNGSDASDTSCLQFLDVIRQNASDMFYDSECDKSRLIFDQTVVLNSIVTEYGLTCSLKYFKNIIGAIYMV
jgi:hypothetical protein